MARLVAPLRRMQRMPARVWRTLGAVDMAPVAIAADDRLGTTAWVRAHGQQPGLRQAIMLVTAAPVMRPPMAWTHAVATRDDAPAIVPLHGVGHGAEAKLPGDGSAPCLPSQSRQVCPHHPQIFRGQTLGRRAIPDCPRWSRQELPPFSLRCAPGRPASRAGPSVDHLGQSGAPS